MHQLLANLHKKHFRVPEMPADPPDPESNPQVSREDYEYSTPKERLATVRETIIGISDLATALRWLNQTDPDAEDNFPGAVEKLHQIFEQIQEYRHKKVWPWL